MMPKDRARDGEGDAKMSYEEEKIWIDHEVDKRVSKTKGRCWCEKVGENMDYGEKLI